MIATFNNIAAMLAEAPDVIETWDLGMQIALTVGILVSVTMLVVSVFGHAGAPKRSHQREAALATGHEDRRTVFEQPVLGPLLWLLMVVAHSLNMPRIKRWLERTIVAAGSPNFYTADEYLAVAMLTGLVLGGVLGVFHLMVSGEFGVVSALGGLVIGFVVSVYSMYDKMVKRLRLISKRVPYALDLIALAMGAGATFTEAVGTVVRDANDDDPFLVELKTVLAEIELGTTRRKAMENLSGRVPLDLLQSIVASVIQAEELGTPLGQVLRDQATLLRLQRSARAENAAAVASVRILVPCILLVMAVILTVFGPAIVRASHGGLY